MRFVFEEDVYETIVKKIEDILDENGVDYNSHSVKRLYWLLSQKESVI